MSDIQADERTQRLQRELELIPQIQQAMMQANRGLEMLVAIGGLSQAEVRWAEQAQLAVWDRAMVLEGMGRGREISLAQTTQAAVPAEVPGDEDEVPSEPAPEAPAEVQPAEGIEG